MSGGEGPKTWCAASTALKPKELAGEEQQLETEVVEEAGVMSCVSEAQISPDGTSIFTTDYARKFSVYPFASNITADGEQQALKPYAQFGSADPIWAFAVNPLFDVSDWTATTVLVSRRDQYIGLHNALWDISRLPVAEGEEETPLPPQTQPIDISSRIATYKLVDKLTEAVTAPISLAWSPDSHYFYAGQRNKIAVFDITYTDDPIASICTIPSARNKLKGGGYGFKGDVSALALSPTNPDVLAAGTRNTRNVGIYDTRTSKEVTHFPLPSQIDGRGVTQMKWSPDGQYLYIAERKSDALLLYDVRNFSFALAHCVGRKALTCQKMDFDVWTPMMEGRIGENHEVLAGGTDGNVRVWRSPYVREGAVEADEVLKVGEDPVSSVLMHPHGHAAVVARGKYEVGPKKEEYGIRRGGAVEPAYREWGCLDILGLKAY